MRRLILSAILIGGLCSFLQGQVVQTRKEWLAAADSAFILKDYYPAFKYYDAALSYDTTSLDVWYRYSESARLFNAYSYAEQGYLKVLELDKERKYPQAYLGLAQVRQKTGKYALARSDYAAYLENPVADKPGWLQTAAQGVSDCDVAALETSTQSRGVIGVAEAKNQGIGINTEFSDFGAVFRGDTVFYTSFRMQKGQGKVARRLQQAMIRVMQAADGVNGVILSDSFNLPNRHIAYSAFLPDGSGMYFSICEYLNASDTHCELYFRKRLGPDAWGAPIRLDINSADHTNTQPAVGRIAGSTKDWLFFVSNRPGGAGEMDIWYGEIEADGNVLSARNLSALNTTGNDAGPLFHDASQFLYFSSEGRSTLGGYDIYRSRLQGMEWEDPQHLKAPANSSYDDVHYSLNGEGDKALLSSNRKGAIFLEPDKEVCCYDIYTVAVDLNIRLNVLTLNAVTREALTGVTLSVYEKTPAGEKLLASKTNTSGNDFDFTILRDRQYRVIAQRSEFIAAETQIDLGGVSKEVQEMVISRELYLDPMHVNLTALTFDDADNSPLKGAKVEIFEIVNGDTIPSGSLMNEAGNEFYFTINVNSPYVIEASKLGYETLSVPFEITSELLRRLSRDITVELPLQRVDFPELPIALYFDNALPDGRSLSRLTNTEFKSLCEAYYSRKQVFMESYLAGASEEQKFATARLYETFFEREVLGGLKNLQYFSEQLLNYLGKGRAITIELQGYASPRASTRFNEIISSRRVKSVVNFFRQYHNGAFIPYLQNGQFEIIELAFGESKSKKEVPDRLDDLKGSVYSIEASVERRVEIIKVSTRIGKPQ